MTDIFFDKLNTNKKLVVCIENNKHYTFSNLLDLVKLKENSLIKNKIPKKSVIALNAFSSFNTICWLLALAKNKYVIYPLNPNQKKESIKFNLINYLIDNDEIKLISPNKISGKVINKLKSLNSSGLILTSSGTTGTPKAVLHNFDEILKKYLKLNAKFKSVLIFKLDHISGIETLLSIITPGGTIILTENNKPENVLQLIEMHKSNLIACSPSFLKLAHIDQSLYKYNINSLKYINLGAERSDIEFLKILKQKFPDIDIRQAYGTTETSNMRTYTVDNDWINLGKNGEDYKIEKNKLLLKNHHMMIGYLDNDELFENEWFETNDLVEIREDGNFRITGRKEELINTGGYKVKPLIVENIIRMLNGVEDVKVIGEPNIILGEIVTANIVTTLKKEQWDSLKKNILIKCRKDLDKYMVPVKIKISNKLEFTSRLKRQMFK